MLFILNKLRGVILVILAAIQRALCCFRARRKTYSNDGDECLTDVGIIPNKNDQDLNTWDKWNDDPMGRPQTIQDHIQMYREKITKPVPIENVKEKEELDNLFQEMTPQYIKQKRIIVGQTGTRSRTNDGDMSRLSVSADGAMDRDLGEWLEEGASGWDEQHIDPLDIIKEQRRAKREHRQQHNVGIGKKLKT